MDTSQFKVNEKPDEYDVTFRVEGEVRTTVKAASLEKAKEMAAEMMEEDGFGSELDSVDFIDIDYLRKSPPMYLVSRDGRTMQVSHLKEGDQPREPHEYDFL
jgi:hypothetical protein